MSTDSDSVASTHTSGWAAAEADQILTLMRDIKVRECGL